MKVTVVNNLGHDLPEQVASLPGLHEIRIDADAQVPPDLQGDVIFTHTRGAPNLEAIMDCGATWVHVMGVGIDEFPLELIRSDQTLTCARGSTATPISEFALAAMLGHAKALPDIWIKEPPPNGWHTGPEIGALHGHTAVVVGVGGIGAEVARLSLAFGMRVIGVRRRRLPAPHVGMEITTDLSEVIGDAHHLVLATPATHETVALIDREMLARVTPGLHIVNIARGALIDQTHYAKHLTTDGWPEPHSMLSCPNLCPTGIGSTRIPASVFRPTSHGQRPNRGTQCSILSSPIFTISLQANHSKE